MNKLPLLILLLGGVLLVSGCQSHKEENKSSKVSTEETTVIETVAREQSKESFTSEATKTDRNNEIRRTRSCKTSRSLWKCVCELYKY